MHDTLDRPWWALRLTYGLIPIIAGLDKFTNLLTDWKQYLHPLATEIVPVSASTFMHGVGIIEVVAGILVLSPKTTRFGAYLVSIWLALVGISLVATGKFFDVAVRDFAMAIGAYSLAKLTEARSAEEAPVRARIGHPAHAVG